MEVCSLFLGDLDLVPDDAGKFHTTGEAWDACNYYISKIKENRIKQLITMKLLMVGSYTDVQWYSLVTKQRLILF